MNEKQEEEYLYKIAKRVLDWAECSNYTEEQLWDLIMQELCNIKRPELTLKKEQ